MNISKENIDALNAVIKINIAPEDYKPRVDTVIKKYQKTANIPGFRAGMVPLAPDAHAEPPAPHLGHGVQSA